MAITQTTPRASLSSHTSTNVARAHALPSRIPSRSFSHAHTQPHTPILSHTLSPATVSRSGGSNPSPGAHSHPRPRHSPSSGPSGLLGGSAQWAAQPPCAPRFTDAAASSAGNAPRASSTRFLGGRARAAGWTAWAGCGQQRTSPLRPPPRGRAAAPRRLPAGPAALPRSLRARPDFRRARRFRFRHEGLGGAQPRGCEIPPDTESCGSSSFAWARSRGRKEVAVGCARGHISRRAWWRAAPFA